MPVFGNDESIYCPLIYTIDIPVATPWITEIAERTVEWQTDGNAFASATYSITVTATGPDDIFTTQDFILVVELGCSG